VMSTIEAGEINYDNINTENLSEDDQNVTLSKNQARKRARYLVATKKKKSNRKQEQEKRREKYKQDRQNGGLDKAFIRNAQLERLSQSLLTGTKVCIDLQFEDLMNGKELNHLANQLKRVYSSNKASLNPFHLHFLGLSKQSKTYYLCKEKNEGFENYVLTFEEQGLTEVFHPSDLIYLSPDSENILEFIDNSKVYVIGGLVDDSVKKNTSFQFSKEQNVRTCRLPITDHMKRQETGSYKQILTINQVFDVLLTFHETNSWNKALGTHVPAKTGFVLKSDE
jgi:tRNA (guanine9-N1)-methyltransferase